MGQKGSKTPIVLQEDEKFHFTVQKDDGKRYTYTLPCRRQDSIDRLKIDQITYSDNSTYAHIKYTLTVYYTGRYMPIVCDTLRDAHNVLDVFVREWTKVRFEKYRRICTFSSSMIKHHYYLLWNCYEHYTKPKEDKPASKPSKEPDPPKEPDSPEHKTERNGYERVPTTEEI